MPYATEKEDALPLKLGYTHNRDTGRGSSFKKSRRRAWSTRQGWQTADLIKHPEDWEYYAHHLHFKLLSDALNRSL